MKRTQPLGLALATLLVFITAGTALASFTVDFAPANWNLSPGTNPGTYEFTGTGAAETLTITGSSASGSSDTIVMLQSPYSALSGFLSFSWSLAKNGNNSDPLAYFYIDGGPLQQLLNSSGTVSGILLPAHTVVAFELSSSVLSGASPARLEISNWQFTTPPITAVPEASSWLAGTLALSVLAAEALRWKRRAPAAPIRK